MSRHAEGKQRRVEAQEEGALVEALFPGSPSEREFRVARRNCCVTMKLMLRTILNKVQIKLRHSTMRLCCLMTLPFKL